MGAEHRPEVKETAAEVTNKNVVSHVSCAYFRLNSIRFCSEFPTPAVTCGCSNTECPGDQINLK